MHFPSSSVTITDISDTVSETLSCFADAFEFGKEAEISGQKHKESQVKV